MCPDLRAMSTKTRIQTQASLTPKSLLLYLGLGDVGPLFFFLMFGLDSHCFQSYSSLDKANIYVAES